jgi:hypothetical protein
MEVKVQLHALAALLQGKNLQPTEYEAGRVRIGKINCFESVSDVDVKYRPNYITYST